MKQDELISKLFGFSIPTYYNWKREKRPVLDLIEKYFSKDDLKEFLKCGSISKIERLKELEEIEKKYFQIVNITKD